MPNVRRPEGPASGSKQEVPESGAKQAAEVNESHLGVPGYTDDPIFSYIRYSDKAERSLRKCDFEEFKAELIAFINLYNEAAGGAAEGVEKMNEHKQAAFSKIEGFPELVADFDQFLTASKVVMRRPTAMQYQDAVAPELANL
ncbi:hypothetical protein EDB80DRAFT_691578 [Ilyonectria destructans]|nr:hypothetical protein EDB80DRAFT_691578 [Ilyonectria destructans]